MSSYKAELLISQHHIKKVLSCFSFSSVPWLCPQQFNRRAFQSGYQPHFRPCWLSCLLAVESPSPEWYFLARKGEHITLHYINYRTIQRRDPLMVFFVFMFKFLIICLFFILTAVGLLTQNKDQSTILYHALCLTKAR